MAVHPLHLSFPNALNFNTDCVDVMLDVHGYKSTPEDAREFDALAHQIFKDETAQENLDALIGQDQNGNLWIYASEEAKSVAESRQNSTPSTPVVKATEPLRPTLRALTQIASDTVEGTVSRAESEPAIPTVDKSNAPDEGYSYAKTLRLTSDQLVYFPASTLLIGGRKDLIYTRGRIPLVLVSLRVLQGKRFALHTCIIGNITCQS